MYWLSKNRFARLIGHNKRKRVIGDARIAARADGQALFDRAAGRCKFETRPALPPNAVLHIEIIGQNRSPCSRWSAGMECGVSAARQSIPASVSHVQMRDSQRASFRNFIARPVAECISQFGCYPWLYPANLLKICQSGPPSDQFGLLWVAFLGILSSNSGSARSISRRAIRSIKVAVVSPRLSASIAAVSTFLARPSRLLRNAITVPLSEGAR